MLQLRPKTFKEFIGQEKIKKILSVIIESAKKRKQVIDHILFHGIPGTGKTTLATVIANEVKTNIRYMQGPSLEKKADILSLFASIKKGDIVFIDEIHAIKKNIEEMLYSIMEEKVIDVAIGPEGESRVIRMKIPDFTLIGATTKLSKISSPLHDRFGIICNIVEYSIKDLVRICQINSKKLNVQLDEDAKELIAGCSRSTPRILNNILKRCVDFATIKETNTISLNEVKKTLDSIGIYKNGLNDYHLNYLKTLSNIFDETSVSLDTITGIMNETRENIEQMIEPLLLKEQLILKSSRGRKITSKGVIYLTKYNLFNT